MASRDASGFISSLLLPPAFSSPFTFSRVTTPPFPPLSSPASPPLPVLVPPSIPPSRFLPYFPLLLSLLRITLSPRTGTTQPSLRLPEAKRPGFWVRCHISRAAGLYPFLILFFFLSFSPFLLPINLRIIYSLPLDRLRPPCPRFGRYGVRRVVLEVSARRGWRRPHRQCRLGLTLTG